MKLELFLCLVIINQSISLGSSGPYNAIFNFGDSISDTGNSLLYGDSSFQLFGKFPYGETFFGKPTGRASDGRLIVDFLAEAFGLPHLPPYLALTGQSRKKYQAGVNFAVVGATALDRSDSSEGTNSLSVQLGWFMKIKPFLCASEQDCKRFFKKALFLVGEIGGNDYNYPLFSGKPMLEVEALVPPVVEAIINAIITLINEGVTQLVVPGNLPIGCSVIYLSIFDSQNENDYDSFGCLKALNAFSELHNSKLNSSLEMLRQRYPHANIVYADYYGAKMQYIYAPELYGFCKETLFKACCGGGGLHNYNRSATCGSKEGSVCENPSSYQNWDGVHLTEAAYRVIFNALLNCGFAAPSLTPYVSSLVSGGVRSKTQLM